MIFDRLDRLLLVLYVVQRPLGVKPPLRVSDGHVLTSRVDTRLCCGKGGAGLGQRCGFFEAAFAAKHEVPKSALADSCLPEQHIVQRVLL